MKAVSNAVTFLQLICLYSQAKSKVVLLSFLKLDQALLALLHRMTPGNLHALTCFQCQICWGIQPSVNEGNRCKLHFDIRYWNDDPWMAEEEVRRVCSLSEKVECILWRRHSIHISLSPRLANALHAFRIRRKHPDSSTFENSPNMIGGDPSKFPLSASHNPFWDALAMCTSHGVHKKNCLIYSLPLFLHRPNYWNSHVFVEQGHSVILTHFIKFQFCCRPITHTVLNIAQYLISSDV